MYSIMIDGEVHDFRTMIDVTKFLNVSYTGFCHYKQRYNLTMQETVDYYVSKLYYINGRYYTIRETAKLFDVYLNFVRQLRMNLGSTKAVVEFLQRRKINRTVGKNYFHTVKALSEYCNVKPNTMIHYFKRNPTSTYQDAVDYYNRKNYQKQEK